MWNIYFYQNLLVDSKTREKELYGVRVEPLQLGPILGTNLQLSHSLLGYQVLGIRRS